MPFVTTCEMMKQAQAGGYAIGAFRSLADYGSEEEQDDISQDAIIEYLAYNDLSGAYLYEQLAEAE